MKQYPVYKDSGVKWVGKIPSEWGLIRLKYLTSFRNGYAFDSDEYAEDGLPIMRIGDVSESIDLEAMKKVPKDYEKLQHEFGINYGDVLLALTGATIGKTAVFNLHEKVLLNQRVAIIRPRKKLDNGYLKYIVAFSGFKRHIDFECEGGAQDNIGKGEVGDFLTPLPDLTEQKVIVGYLDRKTAQIDDLIAKKERMIGLLKEERTAIINQAVTKGLDLRVEMKDSGIEWLGKVPKHWHLKKLKYMSLVNSMALPETTNEDYEFYYVDIGNVDLEDGFNIGEKISFGNAPSRARRIVRQGDTIVSTVRTYLKAIAYFEGGVKDIVVSTGFAVVRPQDSFIPKFLYYVLRSEKFIDCVCALSVGVSYPAINSTELSDITIWYPDDKEEQKRIAEYLDSIVLKTKMAVNRLQAEIERLKEYRTALISEVVTGKIDVRA